MISPEKISRRTFGVMGGSALLSMSVARLWAVPSSTRLVGPWAGAMVREGHSLQIELSFCESKHPARHPSYYCPMDSQVHSDRPGKCPVCGMDLVRADTDVRATFTALTQSAMEYPLQQLRSDANAFHALLGDSILLDGTVVGDALRGKFTDAGEPGTFELHRTMATSLPYDTRTVTFRNGSVTLAGTVCLPRSRRKHSAVVLLHGSGAQSRWGINRYLADQFARAGFVALAYDKRGSGDSTGAWETTTYEDLAGDALCGVDFLRALPEVDSARIGLHGHSEGGIVAPVAVNLAPRKIAFVVAEDTIAGPVYQQDLYRTHVALLHSNFTPQQVEAANCLYSLFIDVARGAAPRQELKEAVLAAQSQPWLSWLDLPGDDSWIWTRYPKLANVDTLQYWAKVHVPVLLVYGERDQLMPVDESLAKITGALVQPDSRNGSFIVPGAQHNLTIQPEAKEPFFWWRTAPGIYPLILDWVRAATSAPHASLS